MTILFRFSCPFAFISSTDECRRVTVQYFKMTESIQIYTFLNFAVVPTSFYCLLQDCLCICVLESKFYNEFPTDLPAQVTAAAANIFFHGAKTADFGKTCI